jgi:two-component sensor histidine kinase
MIKRITVVWISVLLVLVTASAFAQPQGKKKIDELTQKLEQAVLDTQKANILNALSTELRRADTAKAFLYASQALTLSQREQYPAGESAAYTNLAEYYRIKDDQERALEYYHKALSICEELNLDRDACKLYNKIGVIHQTLADYDLAYEYFQRSFQLNTQFDDKPAIAGSYNNIGNIYYLRGNYERALENYLLSLKIREQTGDKPGMAASYNNIANIYSEQRNYSHALDYYMRGIMIKEELGDKKSLSNSYSNLGALYYKINDDKKAMQFYLKAKEASTEVGDNAGLAIIYSNIGNVLRDDEKYAAALENYNQARKLYSEAGDKRGISSIYNSIGELYVKMKNYSTAIANLVKGLEIAKSIDAKEEIRNSYSALAQASEGTGDYRQANQYYRDFIAMKDSLSNEASAKMITEMETKYRSGKKQKEIDLLKKEKEIQTIKFANNRMFTYAWMGGAFLLLVLAIVVVANNRQKQKVNSTLTEQNRKISRQKEEKEVLLKEVHHRVKNNLQVISSLLSLQSIHITDPEVAILFTDCQNRVRSMALIHEKLYTAADLSKVELRSYVESLAQSLLSTYQLNNNITLDLQLSVKSFGVNTLIPVGLLLNELISNSLKHAFTDDEMAENGVITVKLRQLKDHNYEMIVGDNGAGMPHHLLHEPGTSLGMELVHTFVEQLEGGIERLNEAGTVFRIVFTDIEAVQPRTKVAEEAMLA